MAETVSLLNLVGKLPEVWGLDPVCSDAAGAACHSSGQKTRRRAGAREMVIAARSDKVSRSYQQMRNVCARHHGRKMVSAHPGEETDS